MKRKETEEEKRKEKKNILNSREEKRKELGTQKREKRRVSLLSETLSSWMDYKKKEEERFGVLETNNLSFLLSSDLLPKQVILNFRFLSSSPLKFLTKREYMGFSYLLSQLKRDLYSLLVFLFFFTIFQSKQE